MFGIRDKNDIKTIKDLEELVSTQKQMIKELSENNKELRKFVKNGRK